MRLGFDFDAEQSLSDALRGLNVLGLVALLNDAERSPSEAAEKYSLSRRMVLRLGGLSRSDVPVMALSAVLLFAPTATASLDDGLRAVEQARTIDLADGLLKQPAEVNYQTQYLDEVARAVQMFDPILVGMRFRLDPEYCSRLGALDPVKRESLAKRVQIPFGFSAHMLMSMLATAVVGGDRDDSRRVNTLQLALAVQASRALAS